MVLSDDYTARVNRVIDHIQGHLEDALSLNDLARIARFSPFHFHRVFREVTGETCHRYVRRIRLERAASRLIHNPQDAITTIALECGFSSPEAFARAFKDAFGVSASTWRAGAHVRHRKNGQVVPKRSQADGKTGQAPRLTWKQGADGHLTWRLTMKGSELATDIHVENLEPMPVAYLRHIGPYAGNGKLFEELFTRLMHWAEPRGLLTDPSAQLLSLYQDDPSLTSEDKLQLSVCITVPEGTRVDGEVGTMVVPGGRYAVARCEITETQYPEAWSAVYEHWLPQSGYQSDERPAFERMLNNPAEHPEGKHVVMIHVPVRPR